MKSQFLLQLKDKMKAQLFAESDVVTAVFSYSFLHPKTEKKYKNSIKQHVLDHVVEALSVGELPQLNPTFSDNLLPNSQELDKESLLEFITNNCYYSTQELDINNDYVEITVLIEMLFMNFVHLKDDILTSIDSVRIKSFLGEFQIGQKKEEEENDLDDIDV